MHTYQETGADRDPPIIVHISHTLRPREVNLGSAFAHKKGSV